MASGLFREKSLRQVTSPEQLNDYIKVASPGVWAFLTGLLLLLLGACVWGVSARLETSVPTAAVCREGVLTCYIPEDAFEPGGAELEITIDGSRYPVLSVSGAPEPLTGAEDAYALHLSGLAAGDWAYTVRAGAALPDGVYEAGLVLERVSPLSFLLN